MLVDLLSLIVTSPRYTVPVFPTIFLRLPHNRVVPSTMEEIPAQVQDCDGTSRGTVTVIDEYGNRSQQSRCFYFKTLPDALEEAGITWRYYAEGGGFLSVVGNIRHSVLWKEDVTPTQFIADAKSGHLPAVSWLLPPGEYSEHPPGNICEGENWTVSVLNAVMQGPDWNST